MQQFRVQRDSLEHLDDSLNLCISSHTLQCMKLLPRDTVWMEELYQRTRWATYQENCPYKTIVETLYQRLSPELKYSERGKQINLLLYPPKRFEIGDRLSDISFITLEGKQKKLSDFEGKPLLLDFWSSGCDSLHPIVCRNKRATSDVCQPVAHRNRLYRSRQNMESSRG